VPLGEYLLSHDNGGTVSPAYVWVTPKGWCAGSPPPTPVPAQSACSSMSLLPVTAS